jgi:outer membrane immunogenic protein
MKRDGRNRWPGEGRGAARFTAVSLLAFALGSPSPAHAQDRPAASWTGCHAGVYAGGAFGGRASTTDEGDAQGLPWNQPLGNSWSYPLGASPVAGGMLGCDYQTASPFVVGLEAELGYLSLSGSGVAPVSPHGDTRGAARIGNYYGAIAPRVGWSFGQTLLYLKAGFAFAGEHASVIDTCDVPLCGGGAINAVGDRTSTGWAGGGGAEYALNERWTVRAEYLYLGLDDDLMSCGTSTAGVARGSVFCFGHRVQGLNMLKLGIAYRFWTPAP